MSNATPNMQQRIKALGVATPIAISSPIRRSNPGTPTQARRPDFISVPMMNQPPAPTVSAYYDLPMTHGQQGGYTTAQAVYGMYEPSYNVVQQTGGSPQRRYLSEGDMLRQNNELARSTNTSDNIRELAGSPQKGVYVWKNSSPNYASNDFASNAVNLLRQQQQQQQQLPPVLQRFQHQQQEQQEQSANIASSGYHPALRGGVQVFPPAASPQIKRKTMNTRPISFVRALEMTDSIEMATQQNQNNGGQPNNLQQSGELLLYSSYIRARYH